MHVMEHAEPAPMDWERAYGPLDGPWLRAAIGHLTSDLSHLENIRIARVDDEAEMVRYEQQVEGDEGHERVAGDWELTSPATGIRYRMGCNWRD